MFSLLVRQVLVIPVISYFQISMPLPAVESNFRETIAGVCLSSSSKSQKSDASKDRISELSEDYEDSDQSSEESFESCKSSQSVQFVEQASPAPARSPLTSATREANSLWASRSATSRLSVQQLFQQQLLSPVVDSSNSLA